MKTGIGPGSVPGSAQSVTAVVVETQEQDHEQQQSMPMLPPSHIGSSALSTSVKLKGKEKEREKGLEDVRAYARELLLSSSSPSSPPTSMKEKRERGWTIDAYAHAQAQEDEGRERERVGSAAGAGGVGVGVGGAINGGCREAVELLTRNPKKGVCVCFRVHAMFHCDFRTYEYGLTFYFPSSLILSTASYDVNKDGVRVAVLTFTKSAWRLGETILSVVEVNERRGRARVLQVSQKESC